MTKRYCVVYNTCFGGFGISKEAADWLIEHGSKCVSSGDYWEGSRHDPLLVKCVRELGEKANGNYADLAIEKLDGKLYRIDYYDGLETVQQPTDEQEWVDASKS